ncbi:hypothetical protein [Nocardiopsis algeriensis]|uniref:Uncharacterized protein n=1 Tax=Nocardiopsis algeriensis TaxID=1478215 RepID=A0A841ITP5_9ACTN|nr:hypothetical protein [Nocardiopsis algeriensis]MBB6120626.1 hypothetical protein [Nocardiopsis algeriensis]
MISEDFEIKDPWAMAERVKQVLKKETQAETERALGLLVLLKGILQEKNFSDPRFLDFKKDLTSLFNLPSTKKHLHRFTIQLDIYLGRGRMDGYEQTCDYRSTLQILNDHFVPWEEIDLPHLVEDMESIDDDIREVAEDAPPIREHEIPNWVPDSHWWWRAPKKQDMSEAERWYRRHYEELEP